MIELADTAPDVSVQPAEYRRLLGYPPDRELSERASELADWARAWYTRNGRPWVFAREAGSVEIAGDSIRIEGVPFHSQRLQATLEKAGAHGAILVAAGAGAELEQEARRLWEEGKPDEYFFLEVFGSAAVEHLTHMTGARLCAWAEEQGMAVLPHYSPGYPEWDIAEQARLLNLIGESGKLPGYLEALDSGALRPKKSQLAVFGFTRHSERVRRLTELIPCENCSFLPCQYRRAPNQSGTDDRVSSSVIGPAPPNGASETFHFVSASPTGSGREPRTQGSVVPRYTVKPKALKRWAGERLALDQRADGTIEALFRYEGTTCTNTGRPLTFHYRVTLGSREDGYLIQDQRCVPAPGDTGHTYMCRYLENPGELSAAIAREKPFLGQPLSAVLSWPRAECAPGCYCDPAARDHKWGLVLETIHYALETRGADTHVCRVETRLDAFRPLSTLTDTL
ncbi:MAG TPA: hypothetical protein VGZ73_23795 [Bryobacteraceae bacterium]|jgi:hypothetical protein|nr:hypothetical protein [Bryobacteraceae bacterium]